MTTRTIANVRKTLHNVQVGGLHIHHLVWGILLPLIVGYDWLLLGIGMIGGRFFAAVDARRWGRGGLADRILRNSGDGC